MKTNPSTLNPARGIALIIVMLVIFALTVLVAAFALSMKVETRLAQNNNFDSELEWIGRGKVEIARWSLAQIPQGQPVCLNQLWSLGYSLDTTGNDPMAGVNLNDFPFGENAFATHTTVDLERKWNINALADPRQPKPLIIQQALVNMGVTDSTLASTIRDSIFDWVDPRETHRVNGAKNDYYLHLDPPYFCKLGFIDDISELLLIKGIRENPEIYFGTAPPNMSTYGMNDRPLRRGRERPSYPFGFKDVFATMGSGRLNVNTADALTLQMIPGIDERAAQGIIKMRAGDDGVDGTDDDVPIKNLSTINGMNVPGLPFGPGAVPLQNFCATSSRFFEVTVLAEINGYKRTFHAILFRPDGPSPVNRMMNSKVKPNDPQIVKFYWD